MFDLKIQDEVRMLAEHVLLCDPTDLQQLVQLQDGLTNLDEWLAAAGESQLSEFAKNAAIEVERLVLREIDDAPSIMDQVSRVIESLQKIIIDERPKDEVKFERESETPTTNSADVDTHSHERSHQTDKDALVSSDASAASEKEPTRQDEPAIQLTGDPDLISEFVTESSEHLEDCDQQLLTIEGDPTNEEALNAVFRAFHTIKGVAGLLELTPIQELAHEAETLLDRCRKHQITLAGPALDVVFESTDVMKQLIEATGEALQGDGLVSPHPALPALLPRISSFVNGETVVDSAIPTQTAASSVADEHSEQEAGEVATIPDTKATEIVPKSSPAPQSDERVQVNKTPNQKKASVKDSVRVDAERLDKLVDTIGEMVIAEAMVSQSSDWQTKDTSSLGRLLNHLDKITRELQELAMSLRMLPVRSAFQRMARLARDVSKKLDKPVDFVTTGEDTELDKNVVDAIGDPLVHMVRNAIDHGLEDCPATRKTAGKPESGRVELRAFHKGGSIYIEIEDDGKGLDRDVILAKAIERGLVTDGSGLTDSEVFNLIFEPGFSTAKQVTDVSGRGVGLDVVKRNIQAMRGKTEIRSERGKGTVFSIRLPLTLAIIEGMVVRLGDQRFIIPTLSIVRMVRPGETDLATILQRSEMLKLGDQIIPLHRLDQLFGIPGTQQDPANAAVVVIEQDNGQVAFMVDELLGQQQIVIKPLGPLLQKHPGLAGGAVMPDGRVGLILNVAGITSLTRDNWYASAA